MGERLRHLGAFPKCIGKKPSPPPARAELRDFPEKEFPALLREVPLVWDVHQKIPNEIQCAPSDEIKLAGQVCPPNQGRSRCSVYQRVGLNCAKLHATNRCILNSLSPRHYPLCYLYKWVITSSFAIERLVHGLGIPPCRHSAGHEVLAAPCLDLHQGNAIQVEPMKICQEIVQ